MENLVEVKNLKKKYGLNEAVNITVTDSCTFAQAKVIEDATNSGTITYNISDTSANLSAGVGTDSTAISSAQTVAVDTYATKAEANTIAGLNKQVIYSISDTAANVWISLLEFR